MFYSGRSDFFSTFCKQADILRQGNMYMKRAGDNTGLENTKVVCSVPSLKKCFARGQDPEAGSVLIGLIAWGFY